MVKELKLCRAMLLRGVIKVKSCAKELAFVMLIIENETLISEYDN